MRPGHWLAGLIAATIVAASVAAASPEVAAWLRQGDADLDADRLAQAERNYAAVLASAEPLDSETQGRALFGRSLARQRMAEGADLDAQALQDIVADYLRAAQLHKQGLQAPASFNAGLLLRRTGQHKEALELFLLASRSAPEQSRFLLNAGYEFEELGRAEEADEAYRAAALTAAVGNAARKARLLLALQEGWDGKLIELTRSMSAEYQSLPDVNYALVRLLTRRAPLVDGELADAALVVLAANHARLSVAPTEFEKGIGLDYEMVGSLHARLRDPIRALRAIYGKAAAPTDKRYVEVAGSDWWRTGEDRRRAWSMIQRSLGAQLIDGRALPGVAATYLEAASGYRRPYRIPSWADLEALGPLVIEFDRMKRLADLREVVAAVDRWTGDVRARNWVQTYHVRNFYFFAGEAFIDSAQLDRAASMYKRSLELDPRFHEAYVNLGYVYMGLSEPKAALDHFERAVELDPNNAQGTNNLGFSNLIYGEFEKAIEYLSRSNERERRLLTMLNLGDAYRYAGNVKAALRLHTEARGALMSNRYEPHFFGNAWRYNYMPLSRGDTVTILTTVLVDEVGEKRAFVHFAVALDLALSEELGAARREFDTALKLVPGPEFRCFFANKISAIHGFVKESSRTKQWFEERRAELTRGLSCRGS